MMNSDRCLNTRLVIAVTNVHKTTLGLAALQVTLPDLVKYAMFSSV